MPELREMLDRAFDGALEIGIDPCVPDRRLRPPEGDERLIEFHEIVDAGVASHGVGDDKSVDEAALGHAAQGLEAIVGAVLEKDREVKALLREPPLEPREDGQEHHVDRRLAGAARDHDADEVGLPAPETAAGLIGRIAELGRGVAHALARQGVDVGAVVQRARHGADRDLEVAGKLANSDQCAAPCCGRGKGRGD